MVSIFYFARWRNEGKIWFFTWSYSPCQLGMEQEKKLKRIKLKILFKKNYNFSYFTTKIININRKKAKKNIYLQGSAIGTRHVPFQIDIYIV